MTGREGPAPAVSRPRHVASYDTEPCSRGYYCTKYTKYGELFGRASEIRRFEAFGQFPIASQPAQGGFRLSAEAMHSRTNRVIGNFQESYEYHGAAPKRRP